MDKNKEESSLPNGVVSVLRQALRRVYEEEEESDDVQQSTTNNATSTSGLIQSCVAAKSAQHQVWLVHLWESSISGGTAHHDDDDPWKACLRRGNHRLVVRVWQGQCRWWNLNHQDRPLPPPPHHQNEVLDCWNGSTATATTHDDDDDDDDDIARHELWGYQTAKRAFDSSNGGGRIRIPTVLCTNHNGTTTAAATTTTTRKECGGKKRNYFAILEYVGAESTLFANQDDDLSIDTSWTDGMVTVRDEFGFPEPHPRWGRVPVDQALEYAMQVLQEVVLPLHTYCRRRQSDNMVVAPPSVYTFRDMVALYQRALSTLIAPLLHNNNANNGAAGDDDDVHMLQYAVDRLQSAIPDTIAPEQDMAPVLVHMDLQPQNLIFGRRRRDTEQQQENNHRQQQRQDNRIVVVSVLDWEEAAWADPRFELLLLGRKVCAHREQALAIWDYYQQQTGLALGSLDIWLQLETVHSLTTLLLQAATGMGRSPWEARSDLWGKIQREIARLDGYDK
jgi:hypothetical protein